jgi:hypothetical protein
VVSFTLLFRPSTMPEEMAPWAPIGTRKHACDSLTEYWFLFSGSAGNSLRPRHASMDFLLRRPSKDPRCACSRVNEVDSYHQACAPHRPRQLSDHGLVRDRGRNEPRLHSGSATIRRQSTSIASPWFRCCRCGGATDAPHDASSRGFRFYRAGTSIPRSRHKPAHLRVDMHLAYRSKTSGRCRDSHGSQARFGRGNGPANGPGTGAADARSRRC